MIGLNIYRPEQKNFANRMKHPQQLIGLCKMSTLASSAMPSPPNFPRENLGFSDIITDEDGILCRILLFASSNDKNCSSEFSFPSMLAIDSLRQQNTDYKFRPNKGSHLNKIIFGKLKNQQNSYDFQLGKRIVPQLETDSGGYESLDAAGYQTNTTKLSSSRSAHPKYFSHRCTK
ncbi:serine/threonine kinase [Richelia intracellularis]|nr:serine/threonine kinase [Richelia intracellularis]